MTAFMKKVSSVLKSDSGAVAVEYGLLLSLIAVGLISAVSALGTDLNTIFTAATTKLNTATK